MILNATKQINALLRFSMCSNNKDYIKKTCSYIITINPPTQCLCTNFAITITQNEQIEAGQESTELGCPEEAVKSLSLEVLMTPQDKGPSDLAWILLWPCFELEIELQPSWVPLQPQWCCDAPSVSHSSAWGYALSAFIASPHAGDKD